MRKMTFKINLKGNFNNAQKLPLLMMDFASDVDLSIDKYTVDAKSVMGVLSLNFNRNLTMTITEKSEDEALKIRDLMRDYGFLVME